MGRKKNYKGKMEKEKEKRKAKGRKKEIIDR